LCKRRVARVSTYEIPANRLHAAADTFGQAIEQIRTMPGLAAAYLLVNAENGRASTITFWDTRAAVEGSRVTASRLRTEAARNLDGGILSSEEYEVAARALGDVE
jgi:heme-degrading monooxygenase HmoA